MMLRYVCLIFKLLHLNHFNLLFLCKISLLFLKCFIFLLGKISIFFCFAGRVGPGLKILMLSRAGPDRAEIYKIGPGRAAKYRPLIISRLHAKFNVLLQVSSSIFKSYFSIRTKTIENAWYWGVLGCNHKKHDVVK